MINYIRCNQSYYAQIVTSNDGGCTKETKKGKEHLE